MERDGHTEDSERVEEPQMLLQAPLLGSTHIDVASPIRGPGLHYRSAGCRSPQHTVVGTYQRCYRAYLESCHSGCASRTWRPSPKRLGLPPPTIVKPLVGPIIVRPACYAPPDSHHIYAGILFITARLTCSSQVPQYRRHSLSSPVPGSLVSMP